MIIGKACDKKLHISNINKFSSNVNEVTRAVLNSSLSFTKRFHMHQWHKRHKTYKDATKQKYKKTQNANKQISDFFPLDIFYAHLLFLFACKRFVLFVLVKFLNKEV